MIAVSHVLNKLGNDSELIVMNAAGMPPWIVFRPFLAVGAVVSLLVAVISTYVSPWGLRELRLWATEVRADLVSNVIQPGRFTKLEEKLTLHIRERQPNGQLLGILIDDQRNPKERVTVLAETGNIVKNQRGSFLVLQNGSVQRHETGQRDPALVLFDSYGFDLSRLSNGTQSIKYSVRERYLWELYDPEANRHTVCRPAKSGPCGVSRPHYRPTLSARLRRADLCLPGRPRTTRQGRTMSLLGAVGVVAALRGLGFVGMIAGVHTPLALVLPYIGSRRRFRAGLLGDFPGRDHRASGAVVADFITAMSSASAGAGPPWSAKRHDQAERSSRYFGLRFLSAVLAVFAGTLVLTAMIDFLELMRRSGDIQDISAFFIAKITLFRVPFITERVLPFAVLVGAMFCYLNLSRRLELVVARAAGISAWQFTAPAISDRLPDRRLQTAIYNPVSAVLREKSTRLEGDLFGYDSGFRNATSGLLAAPAQRGRPSRHQRQVEPAAGHSISRGDGISVRPGGTLPRSYRSEERHARARQIGGWRARDFTSAASRQPSATCFASRPR